jgi:hypothetical protein
VKEGVLANEQPVKVWRIYSGEDGRSRMEQIEVAMESLGPRGAVSRLLAGKGVIFRRVPADLDEDWHPAPRRQLIVTLYGSGEVETGDGAVLVHEPGLIELLEDVTGQGHKTRGRGGSERLAVFLPLDDETKLA